VENQVDRYLLASFDDRYDPSLDHTK